VKEELGIDGRDNIKIYCRKAGCGLNLAASEWCPLVDFCEYSNESPGSLKEQGIS
jgi:hypothetical protein